MEPTQKESEQMVSSKVAATLRQKQEEGEQYAEITKLSHEQNQINQPPPATGSFAKKLFNFVGNTLGLRNMLSKAFLYQQPVPTYLFKEGEHGLQLQLKKDLVPKLQEIPSVISYDLFMVNFRTKTKKDQSVPILHIINKKTEGNQVIIYNHGNSCDLGSIFYSLIRTSKVYRVNVLAFDYRGYGISEGEISEESTYLDCEIVMSFAISTLKYEINQLVLWGFSLGSGPAVHLAAKYENIRGLILEAPLASVFVFLDKDIDHHAYTQSNSQEGDLYGSIYKIGKVKCPIILMHGKSDEVIPFKHSQVLFEKYKSENPEQTQRIQCLLIEDLRHNDISELLLIKKSLTATKLKQFISKLCDQTSIDKEYLRSTPVLAKAYQVEQDDLSAFNIFTLISYRVQM